MPPKKKKRTTTTNPQNNLLISSNTRSKANAQSLHNNNGLNSISSSSSNINNGISSSSSNISNGISSSSSSNINSNSNDNIDNINNIDINSISSNDNINNIDINSISSNDNINNIDINSISSNDNIININNNETFDYDNCGNNNINNSISSNGGNGNINSSSGSGSGNNGNNRNNSNNDIEQLNNLNNESLYNESEFDWINESIIGEEFFNREKLYEDSSVNSNPFFFNVLTNDISTQSLSSISTGSANSQIQKTIQNQSALRTKNYTSWTSKYFEKKSDGKNCKMCNKSYSLTTSTGNLANHLREAHNISKNSFKINDKSVEYQLEGQQRQMNLHECFETIQALPKNLQNDINNHLTKWIVNEMLPFSVVNSNNFKELCHKLNKRYQVPSVPSERLFSSAGNIFTKKRNRLSQNNLHNILFLRENCKLFDR